MFQTFQYMDLWAIKSFSDSVFRKYSSLSAVKAFGQYKEILQQKICCFLTMLSSPFFFRYFVLNAFFIPYNGSNLNSYSIEKNCYILPRCLQTVNLLSSSNGSDKTDEKTPLSECRSWDIYSDKCFAVLPFSPYSWQYVHSMFMLTYFLQNPRSCSSFCQLCHLFKISILKWQFSF